MTRRRWIADEWNEISAALLGAQAVHLARVLRAQPGQEFDIVAGDIVRRGVIEAVSENAVKFSLHEKVEAAEPLPLIIALSIIRFERMEWAIEKLTELGVARIVPIIAQRSEKHLAQAAAKRADRWRKIARESAQQSRRGDIPEIADPLPLPRWLKENPAGLRLLLSERERTQTLRECLEKTRNAQQPTIPLSKDIYAAIGPEGGWTDMELAGFAEHEWQSISLGLRILRAETAAIAFASVASAMLKP
jgi:16S rRNA (uracil1498-N3)-methyltransferase